MNTPSALYKYTSPESAELILKNASLKWSSPLEFNDPEELQKVPTLSPSIEVAMPLYIETVFKCAFASKKKNISKYSQDFADIAEATKYSIKQGIKELHLRHSFPKLEITDRLIKNVRHIIHNSFDIKQLRILSLTETKDNNQMWERYADKGTGCCIEFTPDKSSDSYFSQVKKVNYCSNISAVGSAYDMLVYGIPENIEERAIDAIYYTKSPWLAHENEWRLIISMPDEIGKLFNFYKFNTQDITSITFGYKAEQNFIDTLSDIASHKYNHVQLYKAENRNGELLHKRLK